MRYIANAANTKAGKTTLSGRIRSAPAGPDDTAECTTVRLKYRNIICKEVELFRSIPVGRFLQGIPVQIEDFDQSEV